MKSQNAMNSTLVEYVNGIEVIKAFNQGSASYSKFTGAINFFHDSTLAWWKQSWLWSAVIQAVMPTTLLGTLPIGAWLYMTGTLPLSDFITCLRKWKMLGCVILCLCRSRQRDTSFSIAPLRKSRTVKGSVGIATAKLILPALIFQRFIHDLLCQLARYLPWQQRPELGLRMFQNSLTMPHIMVPII